MLNKRILWILGFTLVWAGGAASQDAPEIVWTDAAGLTIEGVGWKDTPGPYHRLPVRAQALVREPVWNLAANSAGVLVRFTSDSPTLHARWKLTNSELAMPHMPATGMSGLDLYVKQPSGWRWLGAGRPAAQENSVRIIDGISESEREFALYLPLYNGVEKLEIGVVAGSGLKPAPPRQKPVVFYGTSITQGGCASRPGMAYPAIIGRRLDIPTINLGFSGNGRTETEMVDLLAELDPAAFVIDPLPNMSAGQLQKRLGYLLKTLREEHPETPVILVESVTYQNEFIRQESPTPTQEKNQILRSIYEEAKPQWQGRLYYVEGPALLGSDGEGTVDGVHPTDLGFLRMADVLAPVVARAIAPGL